MSTSQGGCEDEAPPQPCWGLKRKPGQDSEHCPSVWGVQLHGLGTECYACVLEHSSLTDGLVFPALPFKEAKNPGGGTYTYDRMPKDPML